MSLDRTIWEKTETVNSVVTAKVSLVVLKPEASHPSCVLFCFSFVFFSFAFSFFVALVVASGFRLLAAGKSCVIRAVGFMN